MGFKRYYLNPGTYTNQKGRGLDLVKYIQDVVNVGCDLNTSCESLTTSSRFSYENTFAIGDWIVGSPNTITIPATTHGLGTGYKHVTVFEQISATEHRKVGTQVSIDPTTGDIIISTLGTPFTGGYYITSK